MNKEIEILRMPKLGLSMTAAKVTEWYVGIGDKVDAGDELVEVTTEKISNGVCCNHSGILRRILVNLDETVQVETPLAVIAKEDISEADIDKALEG